MQEQNNPYAAPTATLAETQVYAPQDLESRKAERGKRLGAALLDGLISLIWLVPVIWAAVMFVAVRRGTQSAGSMVGLLVFGIVAMVAIVAINCVLLHRHGQTIGKRALDIAVVRTDGSRIGLGRYILLRILPVGFLAMIPFVGRFVGLVDPLLIFGKERRCLHDLIADTIVVDV